MVQITSICKSSQSFLLTLRYIGLNCRYITRSSGSHSTATSSNHCHVYAEGTASHVTNLQHHRAPFQSSINKSSSRWCVVPSMLSCGLRFGQCVAPPSPSVRLDHSWLELNNDSYYIILYKEDMEVIYSNVGQDIHHFLRYT